MAREGQRPGPDRTDVVATVIGVLAALLATWGVKAALARSAIEQRIEVYTDKWSVGEDTRLRLGHLMERELRPLWHSPRFEAFVHDGATTYLLAGGPGDEAASPRARGGALQIRGRGRLPDAELATYNALRKRVVFASERACPCYWDPTGCSEADFIDGLSRLSDAELSAWYRLSAQAGLAGLEAGDSPPFDQEDLADGLVAIADGLAPEERERFVAVYDGAATAAADKCFAARALFTGIESLEPAQRERFTRALVLAAARR